VLTWFDHIVKWSEKWKALYYFLNTCTPRILTTMDIHFYLHFCVNFAVQPIHENIHNRHKLMNAMSRLRPLSIQISYAKNWFIKNRVVYKFTVPLLNTYFMYNWFNKQNEFQGHFIIIYFYHFFFVCVCVNNVFNSILAYPNGRQEGIFK